ncbi:uncharacterized protein LOC106151126 [Lingula anatina]|uniref:Uncharacterized protein LOC106151126 n=1 Tax=Lingula anatina TaxID=7574 RepID=A0A1S3H0Z5_LINAN|nr:uncharacterized protein LOC106151126 [Lingula anatina]|eukprot:XP_013379678.1 uncharacterized protein LOC106151126 [Lingula anatina]
MASAKSKSSSDSRSNPRTGSKSSRAASGKFWSKVRFMEALEEDSQDERGNLDTHEYQCPDLPPLTKMKDAMARSRVSHGITYLLPNDRGRNSVDNHYRTDLRAMFREPFYSHPVKDYNDELVNSASKVLLRPNTWSNRLDKSRPIMEVQVNSDSEKFRQDYLKLIPRTGAHISKKKQRSDLYLPMKQKVPDEVIKLREEVQNIIKSVQEDNEEFHESDEDEADDKKPQREMTRTTDLSRRRSEYGTHRRHSEIGHGLHRRKEKRYIKTAAHIDSYDQIRNKPAPKLVVPQTVSSHSLNSGKKQDIWEWLHNARTQERDDFEYFLSICG